MADNARDGGSRPLDGIRVLDVSTVIAAPLAAMILADFGAEVIKVEHPDGGDSARTHGDSRDGTPLWWLMLSRNKKSLTLYLGSEEGQAVFRTLAESADVIIENFRPGTMERWGLGYDQLSADNPRLVYAHISGYGRTGPLKDEPGFGTIGETMSGFAFRNGDPSSPPMLPPFGLADGVTGISAALAVVTALLESRSSGRGQEIDLAIIEPLLTLLEPQLVTQDQLGRTLQRTGSQADMNAPRGMYRTQDDAWVAVSASTVSTASRLMRLVGAPELVEQDWFGAASGRRAHAEEIDAALLPWFARQMKEDAVAACRGAGVPVAPVYSAEDILEDEQYAAVGSIATVHDDRLGDVRMPNVLFRLSRTPGRIDWLGPELGQHNEEILGALQESADKQDAEAGD
jgi:crotonobetainyl-CoA:carnitine CoA-transferase CaiB-like acyl-CoA transferase